MRVVISWGPNMRVALTLGRTGWGRYSGNN